MERKIWQISCCLGCGVFLAMEARKWFHCRHAFTTEGSDVVDTFTFLKFARIIPVFETTLSQFSLSAVGGVLYAFEPRVPLLLSTALGFTSLLLNISVPVRFLEASERRGVGRLMAFCVGYLLGPFALTIGPCTSVSVFVVSAGTLSAHIWCLRSFPTLTGYALSAQVVSPFFVIPSLLSWRHAYGVPAGRLTVWVGGMYVWGAALHVYTIVCARWDQKWFDQGDTGVEQRAERARVICRDATTIFSASFVGLFFGVRSVVNRVYRWCRASKPVQAETAQSGGSLRDVPSLLVYGLCVSVLTLYVRNLIDSRIPLFQTSMRSVS